MGPHVADTGQRVVVLLWRSGEGRVEAALVVPLAAAARKASSHSLPVAAAAVAADVAAAGAGEHMLLLSERKPTSAHSSVGCPPSSENLTPFTMAASYGTKIVDV